MRGLPATVALLSLLLAVTPVAANHPGDDLDKVMAEKEKYFQAIDRPAPDFELSDTKGKLVELSNYVDKVVILHFIYASCPDICPLHVEKIADVQSLVNDSPMRGQVQFLSITTDPSNDTADIRAAFGSDHGLDPANWRFLGTTEPAREGSTRALAEAYGHGFTRTPDGLQIHGAVTHVIGPDGRWAANFHGLDLKSLNLILYINGLLNNNNEEMHENQENFWSRITELC